MLKIPVQIVGFVAQNHSKTETTHVNNVGVVAKNHIKTLKKTIDKYRFRCFLGPAYWFH